MLFHGRRTGCDPLADRDRLTRNSSAEPESCCESHSLCSSAVEMRCCRLPLERAIDSGRRRLLSCAIAQAGRRCRRRATAAAHCVVQLVDYWRLRPNQPCYVSRRQVAQKGRFCGFQDSQCARKLLRTRLTAPEYRNSHRCFHDAFAAMRIVLRSANERECERRRRESSFALMAVAEARTIGIWACRPPRPTRSR